ncbi:structure-specific endonuclease subunit SLX4-like [Lingula anatina]|uniref:Structure-specific endonuclease subunit SLX4 n=1 Tax=Lingula anatina TaxID=7574 RepID=A0A1S3IMR4_LINAN|nr:structure-specific endonuclease subunit SLX4-like [Lingula anatina]|eukprot:XP_013399186.1 structure-specific endonuclease subunit SLX4-like [Lingula anatina]
MPNYDDMVTPELKRAVQKYGVRPNMAKKRMRTLLTHIYKETHQYETDTDCEMSFHNEKSDDVGIPAKAVGPDSGDTSDGLPNIDATKEPKGIKRGPRGPRKTKQLAASVSGTERKVAAPKKSTNKVEVNSSPDGTLSRQTQISATRAKSVVPESRTKAHEISSEEEESFSTQEESEEERLEEALLEETIMPEEDEDITPSQQVSSADLHSKLMSFILSDKQLHSKILHYEPLELGDLQDAINAAGIRCGQQKLMEFLDEKCITFTMRKLQKGDRRKKQTKKKDKSVKSTQNNE